MKLYLPCVILNIKAKHFMSLIKKSFPPPNRDAVADSALPVGMAKVFAGDEIPHFVGGKKMNLHPAGFQAAIRAAAPTGPVAGRNAADRRADDAPRGTLVGPVEFVGEPIVHSALLAPTEWKFHRRVG